MREVQEDIKHENFKKETGNDHEKEPGTWQECQTATLLADEAEKKFAIKLILVSDRGG